MAFSVPYLYILQEVTVIHETAVIGGGPAGSATAILLARNGHHVLLLEKSRFPHDKVCGEFISWEAVHYLTRLGIDLQALGAQPINRVRLINGKADYETALPFTAWSLSRRALDEALLALAVKAGADVLRGSSVRMLTRTGDDWTLTTAQSTYRSRNIFLATGKHELQGWTRKQAAGISEYIGFKMHFRLSTDVLKRIQGTVEVYLFDEGYAGLEPIENGRCNLCLLVKKNIYTGVCNKDWEYLLGWLGQRSPHLATALSGATALWRNPLAIYAVPYGFLYRPGAGIDGLFRLGDQMAVIPSFAGDGMSIALHSAQLATDTFHAGMNTNEYYLKARRTFKNPLRIAGWMTAIASSETGRRLLFSLARRWPDFIKIVIQNTRLASSSLLQDQ